MGNRLRAMLNRKSMCWNAQAPSEADSRSLRLFGAGRAAAVMAGTPSGRVDSAHRDHSQGGQARQKEIVATARLDELWQFAADEWRLSARGIAWYDELGILVMKAEQGAGVVAGVGVQPVLQPLLLHEFELTERAGANRHEKDAMVAVIIAGVRARCAIGNPAPQQPAAVVEHG